MKYLALLLIVVAFSSCTVVSKQYYYVPSVAHQTPKNHYSSYFKMVYSKVKVSNPVGDSIGSLTTSNGIGQPLLAGPLIFPVIPVGGFFNKSTGHFIMDVTVHSDTGHFMSLAIAPKAYKRINDSLVARKVYTRRPLGTKDCYAIVNDTLKVPLTTDEFFMGSTTGHSYRMEGDVRFNKAKTVKLVTGNPGLDSTLRNITFKRKSRITFNLLGGS